MIRDSTSWIIGGPKTMRLGSRKILRKFGGNLQNIEKMMRIVYVADEGKGLVQDDQSGAEALIVAYLCQPLAYRQLFIHGIKPHVYVAMHLFKDVWRKKATEFVSAGIPFDIEAFCAAPIQALKSMPYWKELDRMIKDSDNWSLSERYYYLAKQTCHSANYGITPPMFRMNILEKSGGKINISVEDSERFLLIYRSLFPEIPEWNNNVRASVEMQTTPIKYIYNLHGHPYAITSYQVLESNWKEIIAWVPQSTVGMITNIAVARMQQYVEEQKLDWDFLINCHDSMLWQCPIEEMAECGKQCKRFMEQEFESPVDGAKFTMKSEVQAGFNWAPFKKDKNPFGLKEINL